MRTLTTDTTYRRLGYSYGIFSGTSALYCFHKSVGESSSSDLLLGTNYKGNL